MKESRDDHHGVHNLLNIAIVGLSIDDSFLFFFFFNDTATTEIYTLSLHDALPICRRVQRRGGDQPRVHPDPGHAHRGDHHDARSEEHTSELQSQSNLVCRLLLEKKKKKESKVRSYALLRSTSHTSPS